MQKQIIIGLAICLTSSAFCAGKSDTTAPMTLKKSSLKNPPSASYFSIADQLQRISCLKKSLEKHFDDSSDWAKKRVLIALFKFNPAAASITFMLSPKMPL